MPILSAAACEPSAGPTGSSEGDAGASTSTTKSGVSVFVGEVEGTDIRVGVAVKGGYAAVFFCGGESSLPATRWFRGASTATKIAIENANGQVDGTIKGSTASGTVRLDADAGAEEKTWTATAIKPGSVAGLYEFKNDAGVGGVVVTDEDDAQGAFVATLKTSPVAQIIVFRPIERVGDRIRCTVGDETFLASPVVPAAPK